MEKLRVLIVSRQSLVREGIKQILSSQESMEISGINDAVEGVLSTIDKLPPDISIIDVDYTEDNKMALVRRIKQHSPSVGIIILSSVPDDTQLLQALESQAAAYASKEITAEELADIIRRVASGEHPINESLLTRPNIADQVLQQFQELSQRSEAKALISPLTARETEILNYIAQGLLNKQIALKLGISEQTIKNHVTSILRKLNANVRTEAVVVAIKQGLVALS